MELICVRRSLDGKIGGVISEKTEKARQMENIESDKLIKLTTILEANMTFLINQKYDMCSHPKAHIWAGNFSFFWTFILIFNFFAKTTVNM